MNISYDVDAEEDQLDSHDHEYVEDCEGDFCLEAPLSPEQYVDQISRDLLATTLLKDPRTTYVHQSELAGDGTLLALLDAALEWYRPLVDAPLVQPTLSDSGQRCSGSRRGQQPSPPGRCKLIERVTSSSWKPPGRSPRRSPVQETSPTAMRCLAGSPSGPVEPVRLPVVQG